MGSKNNDTGDGASAGKIFIGGLAKETSVEQFVEYFKKYGEITDSVIMKDRQTGRPRGFGFITYADPSSVDKVIAEIHTINGKLIEIKRSTPKGASEPKVFKTKKIFVGGIPASATDDDLESFFSTFGKVAEHQIVRDHATKRSRGFGFVVFESDEIVDNLLVNGNMIEFSGTKVEIKKAEPKKSLNSVGSVGPIRARPFKRYPYPYPYSYPNPNPNSNFGPIPYNNNYVEYRGDPNLDYLSRFDSYHEPARYGPYDYNNGIRTEPTRFGPYDYGYNRVEPTRFAPCDLGYNRSLEGNREGYNGAGARYHPYAR